MFLGAAVCNLGLAFWGGLYPDLLFGFFEIAPPLAPTPWNLVIGLVGLYGLVYLWVAWKPAQGDIPVALGLITKIVGPITWCAMVWGVDQEIAVLFSLVLWCDLVWWLPFCWYLLRHSRLRATVIAWLAVAFHFLASVGLLLVAPGTELTEDFARRQQWISGSTGVWVTTWMCWSLSSISLLALCLPWSQALFRIARSRWIIGGIALIAVGVGFDLAGETVMIVQLTRADLTVSEFVQAARSYQWLSPIIANGLYAVGGCMLSIVAWHAGQMRGLLGGMGFVMWFAAAVLTVATVINQTAIMAVSGAAIMLVFLPWAAWLDWRLRDDAPP